MNHIIKKQTLTIDIAPSHNAWAMQNHVKEVFTEDVLPRLERVCDELGYDKYVSLKLNQLTIDIGTINSRELTRSWAREVENAFRNELLNFKKEKFDDKQVKNHSDREQSELGAFVHFLEKGVLPWWVSDEFEPDPEKLLSKLLTEQAHELVSQIRLLKNKTALVRRLVFQFEHKQLKLLLEYFERHKNRTVLHRFREICSQNFESISKDLEGPILATEIRIAIDSDQGGKDLQKIFELLFREIQYDNPTLRKKALIRTHKQLNNKEKGKKSTLSLEDKKLIAIASRVIDQITGLSEYSGQETTEPSVKIQGGAKQVVNPHQTLIETGPFKKHPDNSPKKDHKQEESEASLSGSHKTVSDTEIPLSAQDKQAWEHIDRIKKLQLAKLDQEAKKAKSGGGQSITEQSGKSEQLSQETSQPSSPSKSSELVTNSESVSETDTPIEQVKEEKVAPQRERSDLDQDNTLKENLRNKIKNDPLGPKRATHGLQKNSFNSDQRDNGCMEQPFGDRSNSKSKLATETGSSDSLILADIQPIRKPDKDTLQYWQDELESIDECYIQNAGLILFWPYLGRFFKDLGLVTDGTFKSGHDQAQAALVLQHLLDSSRDFHEHKLPLNKLLCGLKISQPVGKTLKLSAKDLTRCSTLLEATIQNWPALKGTSIAGFQSSFVMRNGVLKRNDKSWLLQVEKKPFDMLMEQLPWPIGIVRLSWMNKPIYVEW